MNRLGYLVIGMLFVLACQTVSKGDIRYDEGVWATFLPCPRMAWNLLAIMGPSMGAVFVIVIAFAALHFVIFPLVEDRYFSLFYVVTGLTVISALSLAGKAPTVVPVLAERT